MIAEGPAGDDGEEALGKEVGGTMAVGERTRENNVAQNVFLMGKTGVKTKFHCSISYFGVIFWSTLFEEYGVLYNLYGQIPYLESWMNLG